MKIDKAYMLDFSSNVADFLKKENANVAYYSEVDANNKANELNKQLIEGKLRSAIIWLGTLTPRTEAAIRNETYVSVRPIQLV